jgi:hypothetical protein
MGKTECAVPTWAAPQSPTTPPTGTSANAATIHKFQAFLDLRCRGSLVAMGSA